MRDRRISIQIMGRMFLPVLIIVLMIYPADLRAADRVSVKVPIANVRSGPGTAYKVLWKIEKYHPLRVIRSSKGWYEVMDFEGDKAWIFKSLTSETPTVVVRKQNCNIRSGPGLNQRIVFTAEYGVPFRVLKRQGKWIQVQHGDGDKGWIYSSLVW